MSFTLLLAAALAGNAAGGCAGQATQRVEAVLHDATVGLDWLRVRSCAHPEWPAHWQPAPASAVPAADKSSGGRQSEGPVARPSPLVVLAGTPVMVWRDGTARVRISGIAAQSAPLGGEIVVRTQAGWLMHGIVRGPGSVELEASPGWSRP